VEEDNDEGPGKRLGFYTRNQARNFYQTVTLLPPWSMDAKSISLNTAAKIRGSQYDNLGSSR